MATSAPLTIAGIMARNLTDPEVGLIDEAAVSSPEFQKLAARTIPGFHYDVKVRTANMSAAFRGANTGVAYGSNTVETRTVQCYLLNPRWSCDAGVIAGSVQGYEAELAEEATGVLSGAIATLGSQFYYGTDNDALGFPGIVDLMRSDMVVDAGGSGTGDFTSVYAVKTGTQGVRWVVGRDGLVEMSVPRLESIPQGGGYYTGWVQELLARIGLQIGNEYGVARLCNLDSTHTLTDDLLADLVAKFPVAIGPPDYIFLNRTARKQLQKSRTATTPTGAAVPTPTDYDGIPLIVTDNIVDTELHVVV